MKFKSETYPQLKVWNGRIVAAFVDGEFETDDKAVIDALKRTPGVKALGGRPPAKSK